MFGKRKAEPKTTFRGPLTHPLLVDINKFDAKATEAMLRHDIHSKVLWSHLRDEALKQAREETGQLIVYDTKRDLWCLYGEQIDF